MRKVILLSLSFLVFGCDVTAAEKNLAKDQEVQSRVLERAQTVAPAYQTEKFLARKAINEWARRLDSPDKLWYVYMRAESGAVIGYHVCRTMPLSYGVSLTSPQQIIDRDNETDLVVSAPGLDGVYYGAVDPELYFCFDSETDALILFRIGNSTIYDKPLDLEAPRLEIVNKSPREEG